MQRPRQWGLDVSQTSDLEALRQRNAYMMEALRGIALARRLRAMDPGRRFKDVYDGIDGSVSPGGAKRRLARIDYGEETGRSSQHLPPNKRLLAVALLRDAVRNYSGLRSLLLQLRLNVVGWYPNVVIKADGAESAQRWFNEHFVANSDFRDGLPLPTQWGLVLESVFRDGDVGILFDGPLLDSGRLTYYESDQISDPEAAAVPKDCTTHDGVIRDRYGRIVGFGISYKRGITEWKQGEGTVFSRDPEDESKNFFKLVRMPWRFNQGRGISPLLTPLADFLDCYEMRAKELQSAKVAASLAGIVKQQVASGFGDPRLDPDREPEPTETADRSEQQPIYDRLGALTGGLLEYLDPEDTFELLKIDRPNVHMAEFIDHVVQAAGAGVGFARAYAQMKAESNYTAFRGEMVMTWVLFEYVQQWFECEVQDWTAYRAITWAIEHGKCKAPADGWQNQLFWRHPRMPYVDEGREQDALTKRIKNGDIDLDEIFGPDFDKRIDEIGRKMATIREKFPEFAALEMKSGGAAAKHTEQPERENATTE